MKNILVTGGAGFIGSNFIHYLMAHRKTCHVTNLDELTYSGNLDNLKDIQHSESYHFIKGNICDTEAINLLTWTVPLKIRCSSFKPTWWARPICCVMR